MRRSHTNSDSDYPAKSMEEFQQKSVSAGSLNDDLLVRSVITRSIKLCGKSRAQIAEEMSYVLSISVTEADAHILYC